jgi:hypothetical protein
MNFLADEGVDFPVVEMPRSDGHEVLYFAEMDPGISENAAAPIPAAADYGR